MIKPLIVGFLIAISNSAWGACTIYTTNPPIAGPCDDAPVFPAAGIKDPSTPSVSPVPPVSGGAPLPLKDYSAWTSSLIQMPCCVSFSTKAGTITMDLDNGTVDLHGAKLNDAARAFWDTVAQVTGHPAVKQRTYTLDEIGRMRVAVLVSMVGKIDPNAEQFSAPIDLKLIEERVRTYMAAGITPEELEVRAK